MARKLLFTGITLFWLTMNTLLWRTEFAGQKLGAETPVSLVWEKILRSPDDSGLAVNFDGMRMGYVRWIPNIGGEEATGKTANENTEIEGRIKVLKGYTIRADGNFIMPEEGGRIRFQFDGAFSTDNQWTEWSFSALQRPHSWRIAANREKQTFEFSLGEGRQALKQTLPFSILQDPGKLLDAAGVSAQVPGLAEILPEISGSTNTLGATLGVKWQAHQDWMQMGHSRVKVYNLRARILDKYQILVVVSRVGEILRVELPEGMTLVNEALVNL